MNALLNPTRMHDSSHSPLKRTKVKLYGSKAPIYASGPLRATGVWRLFPRKRAVWAEPSRAHALALPASRREVGDDDDRFVAHIIRDNTFFEDDIDERKRSH